MSACETLPSGLPLPLDQKSAMDRHWRGRLQESTRGTMLLSGVNDDSLEDFWKLSVETYTRLDLTKQSDKRMAIWGVAKRVRDMLDEEYVAGMWETALEEQLAWRVADCTSAVRLKDQLEKEAPTWSWASMKGTIIVPGRSQIGRRSYVVRGHTGQRISFDLGDDGARPRLPRKPSENAADMRRELDLANERRRKSSATSRANSQSGMSMLVEEHQQGPGFTQVGFASSPRALSPQRTNSDSRTKEQTQGVTTTQRSHTLADDKRDKEPELHNKKIAIQGFLHEGHLERSDSSGNWSLKTKALTNKRFEVDAFPDIDPRKQHVEVTFVVLALTKYPNQSNSEDTWYEGHGLLLEGSRDEECYRRYGAFEVRYLSSELWEYLQGASGSRKDVTETSTAATLGTNFFLE